MASVFKATKNAERYTILYYDEHGKRRKKMGYSDKRESERLAVKLEETAKKIKDGMIDPRDLAYHKHEGRPLAEHVDDFGRYLTAKGGSEGYLNATIVQVTKILELAKARRISDLSLSRMLDATMALRARGHNTDTVNHYIRAAKGFSRWLWKDGRAREHHLAHLATSSPDSDRRRPRRALTPDEATRVVQAAERGSICWSIEGPERAMLYRLALGTGFRADELRSLTPEDFNLTASTPTARCRAGYTKNGKEAIQPLAQSLADQIRPWLAGKEPGRPIFERLTSHTAEMLRIDLEAASVPYETDSGVADFHSLRGCYISYLVASGASVKTCQTLARHSDPKLTIGIYAKASRYDLDSAVEALPDLTPKSPLRESGALAATGTDGATRRATEARGHDTDESTQVQFLPMLSAHNAWFGEKDQRSLSSQEFEQDAKFADR